MKYSSPAVQFSTLSILPQALYCTSQDILVLSHEPDADFDGAPITIPSDKDDEIEDVDIQTDLCPTTSAKAQTVIARIPTRSALTSSLHILGIFCVYNTATFSFSCRRGQR